MSSEWIYLLKANIGITIFYAFYKLFCQKDTFFVWRRTALLSFLSISFLYPLINIQHWMEEQPAIYELADYYATWSMNEKMSATSMSATTDTPYLQILAIYIYWIGVILLTMRFLIQLLSICQLRRTGQPMTINGQRIISLPAKTNPFSFFGWIFLYLPQLKDEIREEILIHEQVHVHQCHSIDVIASEIACIACWFNPFAWLMKTEIRLNLEYLADKKATESFTDHKRYQYHLLEVSHTNSPSNLHNYFNIVLLKRRIAMMNKKRTHTAAHVKYFLFMPLAAILILGNQIDCVAKNIRTNNRDIYEICEESAQFPGGIESLQDYIEKHIQYPKEAYEAGIEGKVYVKMILTKDGKVEQPTVFRSLHPVLDKEALRVVKSMPAWIPAKQKGECVNVYLALPVTFQIKK